MNELIKYSNGLKLVVNNNPAVRSVAVGIWVGAGSTRETEENNGISHFTEHVMFKGTDKYTSFDIANVFESMGAAINAFKPLAIMLNRSTNMRKNVSKHWRIFSPVHLSTPTSSTKSEK